MQALDKAILFLEDFRAINSNLPIQVAQTFLLVARYPESNLRRLARLSGQSWSAISRNVIALSDLAGRGRYGLVTMEVNVEDMRNRVVKLTPKGERLLRSLLSRFEP